METSMLSAGQRGATGHTWSGSAWSPPPTGSRIPPGAHMQILLSAAAYEDTQKPGDLANS